MAGEERLRFLLLLDFTVPMIMLMLSDGGTDLFLTREVVSGTTLVGRDHMLFY